MATRKRSQFWNLWSRTFLSKNETKIYIIPCGDVFLFVDAIGARGDER